jgi:hypothetical protein
MMLDIADGVVPVGLHLPVPIIAPVKLDGIHNAFLEDLKNSDH